MSTRTRGPRPAQLRSDPAIRQAVASALDAALAGRPEPWARRARRESRVRAAFTRMGLPLDGARIRLAAALFGPEIDRWEAQEALSAALSTATFAANHRRRIEAASRLGRLQGRALVQREHGRALVAALDGRIARLQPPAPRLWFR